MALPNIDMNQPWCTCVPHPEPPSHLTPHPIPLGHPSAPALSARRQALLYNLHVADKNLFAGYKEVMLS